MASELNLDASTDSDVASALEDAKIGQDISIMVHGTVTALDQNVMKVRVTEAECEDTTEDDAEGGQEESPSPAPTPAKRGMKKMPAAVDQMAGEMM